MFKILHIDASVRSAQNDNPNHDSISRRIASSFISALRSAKAIDEYSYRDLGKEPPAFICQDWIGAVFTPDEQQTIQQQALLTLSDQLINEVATADLIVLSTPMYNYGMPAALKAWFDQVIRVNKTFDFDLARGDFPLQPTMRGKTLVIITSCGEFGFEKGGIREEMNHLVPHIKTLSKYLGVEHTYEIAAEYQEFDDDRHDNSVKQAFQQSHKVAQALMSQATHTECVPA